LTWSNRRRGTILENCLKDLYGITDTYGRQSERAPAELDEKPEFWVLGRDVVRWRNAEKIRLTVAALEACTTKFVVGLDAFDVMLTMHPDEVVHRFLQEFYEVDGCRMLFNGGVKPWPTGELVTAACDAFEFGQRGLCRHLNAGCWVADREYALEFWKLVETALNRVLLPDNLLGFEQPLVRATAFPQCAPMVQVDAFSHIFQHMSAWMWLVLETCEDEVLV
jgi:hypothetical protein